MRLEDQEVLAMCKGVHRKGEFERSTQPMRPIVKL